MKSAPGGQLAIEDIFGRDPFIEKLWRALESNSVRMEAERRIGKSHILRKMNAQPADGWETVSMDLESINSAAEFAQQVSLRVDERLKSWKKHAHRTTKFLKYLEGVEVGPVKFPAAANRPENYWKTLLTNSIADLVEQQKGANKRVVFFFDEMPWMLKAIASKEGEQTAMQVLDVLRSLRQSDETGHGFRMILCGSIGLHHVLNQLRSQGYNNQPVNDMTLVETPPLTNADAKELARLLLAGHNLENPTSVPAFIADQTGGFPYYIHWVVSELNMIGKPVAEADVELILKKLFTAAHDPCTLRHFIDRIKTYYPNEAKAALAILDHAAASDAPQRTSDFLNIAKSADATADADRVRELLRLLAVDHYLICDLEKQYTFRHALLRRWWKIEREL